MFYTLTFIEHGFSEAKLETHLSSNIILKLLSKAVNQEVILISAGQVGLKNLDLWQSKTYYLYNFKF